MVQVLPLTCSTLHKSFNFPHLGSSYVTWQGLHRDHNTYGEGSLWPRDLMPVKLLAQMRCSGHSGSIPLRHGARSHFIRQWPRSPASGLSFPVDTPCMPGPPTPPLWAPTVCTRVLSLPVSAGFCAVRIGQLVRAEPGEPASCATQLWKYKGRERQNEVGARAVCDLRERGAHVRGEPSSHALRTTARKLHTHFQREQKHQA